MTDWYASNGRWLSCLRHGTRLYAIAYTITELREWRTLTRGRHVIGWFSWRSTHPMIRDIHCWIKMNTLSVSFLPPTTMWRGVGGLKMGSMMHRSKSSVSHHERQPMAVDSAVASLYPLAPLQPCGLNIVCIVLHVFKCWWFFCVEDVELLLGWGAATLQWVCIWTSHLVKLA